MKAMEAAMFKVVRDVLIKNDGDLLKTAEELGIPHRTLYNYRKQWPELEEYVKLRQAVKEEESKEEGNERWRRYPDE